MPTPGAQGNVEAAALAPDGGTYIAFEVNGGSSATTGSVVKLRPGGTPDPAFGRKGFSRIPMTVDSLAVDAAGRLVAGGTRYGRSRASASLARRCGSPRT